MTNRIKGILMVLLVTSFWGLGSTFAQILMQNESLPVAWLTSIRLLASGVLLLLWASLKKDSDSIWHIWQDKKDRVGLVLFAIIGFLIAQYTYFTSIQTGNAVTTSLLHFISPALVIFYLAFRRKSWPTQFEWSVLALASIGTFFLITDGSVEQLTVPFVSVVWGLISAIAGAFALIYPVQMIKKWGIVPVVGWCMLIGGIIMSFFAPPWEAPSLTLYSLLLLTYIVLFGTLLGFLLHLGSLKYINSFEVGILCCLEPFIAFISSYLLLQHTLGIIETFGGLLIICTVCLVTFMQRPVSKKKIHEQSSRNITP